jgi:manganese transport protein
MHRSVAIPGDDQSWYKKMFAFAGPGALVAVGYMDPGNWTTDIGGGSAYNYDLLFVVLWSSLIALFFQVLSVRLAIATEKDLAQACKQYYPSNVNLILWMAAEIAIIATDLAEVLGSAIAMQLLFGWRLEIGVLVTAADVLLVFLFQVSPIHPAPRFLIFALCHVLTFSVTGPCRFSQGSRIRIIELMVLVLILIIMASFTMQLILSKPQMEPLLIGLLIPKLDVFTNHCKLFMAVSILGATIMPHSLFLHSNMVLTRSHELTERGKKEALKFSVYDITFSLGCAFFVNAAILVVAAATFYEHGYHAVADLFVASALLDPLLGSQYAAIAFGVALLASGQIPNRW